jgi:hypothetical protein
MIHPPRVKSATGAEATVGPCLLSPAAERISHAVVVRVAGASAVVLIVGLRYFSGIIAPLYFRDIDPVGTARTAPAGGRQPSNQPF